MKTNLEDVYAVGDCVMVTNRVTGKPQWSPMGSSANLEGADAGAGTGRRAEILSRCSWNRRGKAAGLNCGRTGLTEGCRQRSRL